MQRLSQIFNALIGSLLGYGLTSGMLNARTNAHLGAFGWPFSPSQGIELHQQIIMFKCIASKVPIPSDLLLSFGECPISTRSSDIPPNVQTLSDFILSPNSLGAEYNRKGSMNNTDLQKLDRCGRTDGKKWQCSNYALANRKYCEKHVNRGRRPSKKLEEDQTSRASILVPPSTRLPAASTVSGAGLHTSLNQTENLQLNTFRHAQTMHLQDITSKYRIRKYENCIVPVPTEPTHSPAKPNLLLQPISPISENNESLSSSMNLDNHKKSFIGESSSASSSVFPEYLMPCEGMRQAQNAMTWDPVSSAASMGGPLGGILANNNNSNNIAFSSPSDLNTEQCNFSRVFVNTLPTHPSHASNHDTDECEFIQAFANTLPPNAADASNHNAKKFDFTWAFSSNRSTEEQNFTLAFTETLPAHASNRNTEGQDSNWPFADTFPPHASDVSNRITEKWDFSWPYANTEERTRAFFDIFPPHTSDASNSKSKEWDVTWPFANTPRRHSFDASNSNTVERTWAFADTLPPLTSDASNRKTERWSWVFADALPPHTSVASNRITEEWNFTSPSWEFADTPLSALTSDASESPTGDFLSTDSETGSD